MDPAPGEVRLGIAASPVHGRWLWRLPRRPGPHDWLVGFHGQGQSAGEFLPALAACDPGEDWLLVSVQALHRHYARRGEAVVATWMTREDRELAIADNLAWVHCVLDAVEREAGAPRRLVFAGFSQGVAMAYRAALLGERRCAGIVAGCSDVPPEFRDGAARSWPPVLMAAGAEDAWYPPGRMHAEADRLRGFGATVETVEFRGGHEWGAGLAEAAQAWLARRSAPGATSRQG